MRMEDIMCGSSLIRADGESLERMIGRVMGQGCCSSA